MSPRRASQQYVESAGSSPWAAANGIVPQRILPTPDLLLAQSLLVVGLAGALTLDMPGWCGVALGLVVALVVLGPVRGQSLLRRMMRRTVFWQTRRSRGGGGQALRGQPFDVQQADGSQIGLCWDGEVLTSLVRVEQDPRALTFVEPSMTLSGNAIPLWALTDCLRQVDIEVDSIDVISRGARSQGHGQLATVYDAVLGPLPAVAHRSVWVAVRVNPLLCTEAVKRRGGERQGLFKAAATATQRVVNRMRDEGLRAQIVTASEFVDAMRDMANGFDLRHVDETWSACHSGSTQLRSFFIEPAMLSTAGMGTLWTVPSQSTSVCVSLRHDADTDAIKVRGLVRFDGLARSRVRVRGLGELPGRQFDALVCGMPAPRPWRQVGGWVVGREPAAVDLVLPASGCGQVVGADEHGRAVALRLFGPGVTRVELCGTLHLAQQVVLRSMALGARVLVHTGRTVAWRAMTEQVGDSSVLHLADVGWESTGSRLDQNFTVEIFDGWAEHTVEDGVTTMVVTPTHTQPSARTDVSLELLDQDHDVVRVTTKTGSAVVTMVATDDEMRYIGASLEMVD